MKANKIYLSRVKERVENMENRVTKKQMLKAVDIGVGGKGTTNTLKSKVEIFLNEIEQKKAKKHYEEQMCEGILRKHIS